MNRIDPLGWTAGLCFTNYGATVGIRVNDPSILDRLPQHLPPGWKAASSPVVDYLYSLWSGDDAARSEGRTAHRLYAGAECAREALDIDEILESLESSLHFVTAIGARDRLFVHAGVVGWGGEAVVIPGRSFSGKSRLVEALVRAGASYFSDEYAVFDDQGLVHPYPKPLSIRGADGGPARKYPVEALGGRAAIEPLPVGLVALTVYRPGARCTTVRLSSGQAVLALLDNTVLARSRPDVALNTLQRVASGALALRGERGEADEAVAVLQDCLCKRSVSLPSGEDGATREAVGS
jgi:hypothetical protein